MESHGDLAKPQPGAQGRLRADRFWQNLSNTLNSIGGGVNKTPDKWKKVWADWKSKTKKKALTIRRHASGTGGGPNSRLTLTALEAKVLGVIGPLAVEGQPEIQEQGFDSSTAAPSPSRNIHPGPSLEIVVEDGMVSAPSPSPPLPAVLLPSAPSTSRQQQPTPRRSPRRVVALPAPTTHPPSTPPQPPTVSPHSSPTTPHRRRVGARRRHALTRFDRAAQFVAVEQRRLQLEEKRERNEARKIEVDQARTNVLGRFADIAEAFLQQYLQSREHIE